MNTRYWILTLLLMIASLPENFSTAQEVEADFASKAVPKAKSQKGLWEDHLEERLKKLKTESPNFTVGVYVKNLQNGRHYSYNGDDYWYVASGIKIPVALAVLRAIDSGEISLKTKVEVLEKDFIDGAGELNYLKPGSLVSVRLLLDQSITFSDNTATDMLIRLVGIDKVNELTSEFFPKAFTPITTLSDVRRRVFMKIHPEAQRLSNMDFIKLKVIKDDQAKLNLLSKLINIKRDDFKLKNFDTAYEAYYSENVNTATLSGYGLMLEKLSQGKILKKPTQVHLMNLLRNSETGKNRIKGGLPNSISFAHKTGTQHKRICDMGVAKKEGPMNEEYVIVACVKGLLLEEAEARLRDLGVSITESGVFGKAIAGGAN